MIKLILTFFYKFIIIIGLLFVSKSIKHIEGNDIHFHKSHKDGHEIDYINNFRLLKNEYSNDLFLYAFFKEISIISYDYTNQLNNGNNKIHLMVSLNNKYIYPLLVSINSALKNSNKNKTTLVYHILTSKHLKKQYINKLRSLLFIYPTNLVIIFYNMGDAFKKFKHQKYSQVAYYRLISPIFIPLDRIIYLDCDVLIFNDLYEMYQTPFEDNYVLGFLDIFSEGVDYLGLKSEKYINSGVLLLNLKKIRKDKKHYELLYMALNHKKLKHHDQTVINYILYPKIGLLPFKYGIFNFPTEFDVKYLYLKIIRQKLNITELLTAVKSPSIMHFVLCYPKVWNKNSRYNQYSTRNGTIYENSCDKFHNLWKKYGNDISIYKIIK